MPGHPADIGGAPVDLARMVIEDIFKGSGGVDQITAGGVQHAFRFAGGTGGIKDKQRIFGIHRDGLMLAAGVSNHIVPPQIAPFLPVDIPAGTFEHHHVLDGFHVRVFQGVIDVFLQRNSAPGAYAFVGGDHQP